MKRKRNIIHRRSWESTSGLKHETENICLLRNMKKHWSKIRNGEINDGVTTIIERIHADELKLRFSFFIFTHLNNDKGNDSRSLKLMQFFYIC